MASRFIHIVARIRISLLFKTIKYIYVHTHIHTQTHTHTYMLFIHSSVDGHLVCFHLLVIINNAAMNWYTRICSSPCFEFFWVYTQKENFWII